MPALALVMLAGSACSGGAVGRAVSAGEPSTSPVGRASTATSASQPAPTGTPTASADDGSTATFPTVGALFHDGSAVHTCTASVLASSTGDTVITAAHCVHGSGAGMTFVPAYRHGAQPYGAWRVTAAYVSRQWQHSTDPRADYAVLTVAPRTVDGRTERLADVTGSEQLGDPPGIGSVVTLVAYNHGQDDVPVTCRAAVYRSEGYPTIDCHGFSSGSSGSPWLTTDTGGGLVVRGVIGGRDQGGCHEYTSHTSSFTADLAGLVRRADDHTTPDSVVGAAGDC